MQIVTAALPYTNGSLHLGHLSGVFIPADVYVRFQRSLGKNVVFLSGSDEYGAAISLKAKQENTTPEKIVDYYHQEHKKVFEDLGISFDLFHRTTDKLHTQTVQDVFIKLYELGLFEEVSTLQYFDQEYNCFLADRFVRGICPICESESYGDSCDNCGHSHSESSLKNPISTLSNTAPILKETTHLFLKLESFKQWLSDWIGSKSDWKDYVVKQSLSLVEGIKNRSITRDLDWGIEVPLNGYEHKKFYVWFDAPIGYISAFLKLKNSLDDLKNPDTKLIHFIGKDNIVFHTVIFPTILKSLGLIVPHNVPSNHFYNLEGKKFSKSQNHTIEPHKYLQDFQNFVNKEDALRYYLLKTCPENQDGDFKWDEFKNLWNAEIVNIVGNFYNRVLNLISKHSLEIKDFKNFERSSEIRSYLLKTIENIVAHIEKFQFRDALNEILNICRFGNSFLQNEQPWKIEDQEKKSTILFISYQILLVSNTSLQHIIPFTSSKIFNFLNVELNLNDLIGDLNRDWLPFVDFDKNVKIFFQKLDLE